MIGSSPTPFNQKRDTHFGQNRDALWLRGRVAVIISHFHTGEAGARPTFTHFT